ncbi:Uncharacterised protein [Segatella copri]|nr:Uncharacterised protein [Segatella copri]
MFLMTLPHFVPALPFANCVWLLASERILFLFIDQLRVVSQLNAPCNTFALRESSIPLFST